MCMQGCTVKQVPCLSSRVYCQTSFFIDLNLSSLSFPTYSKQPKALLFIAYIVIWYSLTTWDDFHRHKNSPGPKMWLDPSLPNTMYSDKYIKYMILQCMDICFRILKKMKYKLHNTPSSCQLNQNPQNSPDYFPPFFPTTIVFIINSSSQLISLLPSHLGSSTSLQKSHGRVLCQDFHPGGREVTDFRTKIPGPRLLEGNPR